MKSLMMGLLAATSVAMTVGCEDRHSRALVPTTRADLDLDDGAGAVEIRGALVTPEGNPSIDLTLTPTGPSFGESRVTLSPLLTAADVAEITSTKRLGGYAQFGCNTAYNLVTFGYTHIPTPPTGNVDVRAALIILCGDVTFTAQEVKLVASRVIMFDARVKVVGNSRSRFSLVTDQVNMHGLNTLEAATDAAVTPADLPALSFAAGRVKGMGQLNVTVPMNH